MGGQEETKGREGTNCPLRDGSVNPLNPPPDLLRVVPGLACWADGTRSSSWTSCEGCRVPSRAQHLQMLG